MNDKFEQLDRAATKISDQLLLNFAEAIMGQKNLNVPMNHLEALTFSGSIIIKVAATLFVSSINAFGFAEHMQNDAYVNALLDMIKRDVLHVLAKKHDTVSLQ